MSLPSLSLFPATQAQVIESRLRSFKEWGRSMSEEEYLRRDAEMDKDEHASNRKLTWVLCTREDPESLEFKCSCETFLRRGLVLRRNSAQIDNETPEQVSCYAIASVFTPERYRRRGYAKHMMRLLHWVLAPPSSLPSTVPEAWGLPPERPSWLAHGHFSALWSDVGHFYGSCGPSETGAGGWVVRDAVSTVWDVGTGDAGVDVGGLWKWLSASDVEKLLSADDQRIKVDIALAANAGETFFTFLPGQGVERFQRRKMEFAWRTFKPPVDYWGVVCESKGPTDPGETSITLNENAAMATWTFEIKPPTLLVTRLRASKENFVDLLSVLKVVAKKHGMEKIEIWNLPEAHKNVVQDHGAVHMERQEHLPAFKWNGAEAPANVVWLNNEKFCWC